MFKKKYVEFMLSVSISGLRVDLKRLIKWASGILSPIYVDNRKALSDFEIRDMIYSSLAGQIKSKKIPYDAVLAAPTGGLHLGAGVAAKLHTAFVIIRDGKMWDVIPVPCDDIGDFDIVIASNPDAIVSAITIANEMKLPFAYIREKKDHGHKNSIEGYSGQTGKALLVDYYFNEADAGLWVEYAEKVITQFTNLKWEDVTIKSAAIPNSLIEFDAKGKYLPVLEDLFSTSESAGKQADAARALGAIVTDMLAIYDYELKESNKRVANAGLNKHSFITATEFLDIAQEQGAVTTGKRQMVDTFLADPRNWRKNQLFEQIKLKKSFLCIGLDSDIDKIPPHLLKCEDPQFEFNKFIIDNTHEFVVAYKPNFAFYVAYGWKGVRSFERTVAYIKTNYPNILVIGDTKANDIGNTSEMWAKGFYETMCCDAMTVSPYMGEDSVSPFVVPNKWAVILDLTSNKGASDFQMLPIQGKNLDHPPLLHEEVLRKSQEWGTSDNMMYVIGATQASYLKKIREIVPKHFLLIPGVGAQGGSLQEVAKYGLTNECGLLVNNSRAIIYASDGLDFATAARKKAAEMQAEMAKLLTEKGLI